MRFRRKLPARQAALLGCALAVVALIHAEGWIWPLKAAAIMIPVSLIVG
jgi:hypothetical protein